MKTLSTEEINELKTWFEKQELPQSLHIDKATYTPNLKETINMLFQQAYICHENPKMQGCIILLNKIKIKLEEKQQE